MLSLLLVPACDSPAAPLPPVDYTLEAQCGDALAAMRMPFVYQLPAQTGVSEIRVRTQSGGYRDLTFGPWGAHASPHTGHTEGNSKADMMLPYTVDYSELTYIPDPQQPCTVDNFYAVGQVQCGLLAQDVLADRFGYVVPSDDFEIVAVFKDVEPDFETSYYAFDTPQWKVVLRRAGETCNVAYALGHVAWLGPELIAAIEARGIDWQNAALNENLSDYENPIVLPAGTVVALPQIVGRPSGLNADYVVPHPDAPSVWTQLEFFVTGEFRDETQDWRSYNLPIYLGLSATEYATWQEIFETNALDPLDPRYGTSGADARRWLWAAEGELILDEGYPVEVTEGLTSALGSWWEGSTQCGSNATLCDEMVTFFPIFRDTTLFSVVEDAFDADTQFVMGHARGATADITFSEIVGIYDYGTGAYVVTEDLDATLRGALVMRIRSEFYPEGASLESTILGYQAVGFDMDEATGRLVLSWGTVHADEASAAADLPVEPPTQATPCTGDSLVEDGTTCHVRGWERTLIAPENVYP